MAGLLWQNWNYRSLPGSISVMTRPETTYPDISDILKRKAEGRRDIVRRSFGERIAMMEALCDRLAPFKQVREQRRAAKLARGPDDAI
jgi:hypothetical protein